jgi:hypothetical protein
LIHARLSTTSVLDESADAVRLAAAPWAALLIATSMPYRFAQMVFADDILELGSSASHYGTVLRELALGTMLAFVVSRWGHAVFARAVRLADASGTTPGRAAWRVSPAAFASYLFTSSFAEALLYMTAVTVLAIPFVTVLGGLAIGTMERNERPSVRGSLRLIARHARNGGILAAMTLVFICALAVAVVNVIFFTWLGLWLAGSALPFDAARWGFLLGAGNRRFWLFVFAAAFMTIEPFWIAANVILVRRAGVAESGDDLRIWFEELRA